MKINKHREWEADLEMDMLGNFNGVSHWAPSRRYRQIVGDPPAEFHLTRHNLQTASSPSTVAFSGTSGCLKN